MQRYGTIPKACHIGLCQKNENGEFVLYSEAQAEIDKKDSVIVALGNKCTQFEEDRDYNAELCKEKDKEIAELRTELAEAKNKQVLDQKQCDDMTAEAARMAAEIKEGKRQTAKG